MPDVTPELHVSSRREFMQYSSATIAAAAALNVWLPGHARAQDGGEVLRVGLVGCGGRGTGAAREALLADPNTRLVAMGDAFSDRLEDSLKNLSNSDVGERVQVEEGMKFTGFDNYQKVAENCDVIVLAAPPGFRPAHLRAAIENGCHVFCEKPIAVDGPGVRHVLETCAMAKEKGLNVISGLCYRYQFAKQATVQRIQDGAIGDILTMQTTYNTGGLWHHGNKDEWSEMEYQMRNWLYFTWLSGDHINEQHIHSLDKIGWVMQNKYPAKATSSGGRVQRTDEKYGNIYDHFNTVYEWDNGVKAFSSCRQWESRETKVSTDVSDWIYGTNGTAELQSHRVMPINGEKWHYKDEREDNMYVNEHVALFEAIRAGKGQVDEYMCHSTLMAIMGRMAAYTGKTVTWEQALNSEESLVPETLAWGPAPQHPIAVPGVTEFV